MTPAPDVPDWVPPESRPTWQRIQASNPRLAAVAATAIAVVGAGYLGVMFALAGMVSQAVVAGIFVMVFVWLFLLSLRRWRE